MTEHATAAPGWMRRLARYCWRYPRTTLLALAGTLVVTGVSAIIPLIQRQIVDDLVGPGHPVVWPLAVALAAAAVINFAGLYLRRYRAGRLSLDVQHDLRTEMFHALSRLDGARQDELHTGQVVSRSISDLSMVQALLSMVPMLLGNAVLFVVSLAIMAVLSPTLTLIALAVGPALWFISVASRRKLFPASWDAQQQAAAVAGVVDGAVTGVRVVKGFGQEDQETSRLEQASRLLYASRVRAVRLMARYNPALQSVPALGQVGVLALGGWLAIQGSITLGTFVAFSVLPDPAGRPGPGPGRPGHHRAGSPGQRDPGLRSDRLRAGDPGPAGRRAAARRAGRRAARQRQLRLPARPAGAARLDPGRRGG